eukprot:UN05207
MNHNHENDTPCLARAKEIFVECHDANEAAKVLTPISKSTRAGQLLNILAKNKP